jgi:hypothetical protein
MSVTPSPIMTTLRTEGCTQVTAKQDPVPGCAMQRKKGEAARRPRPTVDVRIDPLGVAPRLACLLYRCGQGQGEARYVRLYSVNYF